VGLTIVFGVNSRDTTEKIKKLNADQCLQLFVTTFLFLRLII